jgi:predicted permease
VRTLIHDLRYGFRVLRKSPGFTAVAVLTLALGIGASTTVFSWIDSVLLRPLPGVADPATLVAFETVTPNHEFITTSYPDYRDYRDHLTLLDGITGAQPTALSLGQEDHAERVWGELVTGNYFAVLGVRPFLGRMFSKEEYGDKPGAYPVAVISHQLWRTHFHSDPAAIGQTIRVNRQELTVVGVAPPEFRGSMSGVAFDIWAPLMMTPQLNGVGEWMLRDRQTRNMIVTARLKPGVAMEQAHAEIAELARRMAEADPGTNRGISATVLPLWTSHFGVQGLLLAPFEILMAVCVVVLMIVCANIANLLLARSAARNREFSVRMAMGAGRLRVVRQMLTESVALAGLGALAGVPLAVWSSQLLQFLLPPTNFPLALEIQWSGRVLVFTILVCVAAAVVSGVAPAVQSARADLNASLKEGGRGAGARSNRLRGLLVVSEVSLALVALIGAGLFARGFQAARRINPGFDPNHVLLSHFYLSTSGYPLEGRKQFCLRLRRQLEGEPGVTAVAYADQAPLGISPSWWEDLRIEGYEADPGENMKIYRNVVSPGYFAMMRIPMVDGRDFTEHDDLKSNAVMIVNETFARKFFAGRNPIGRRVHGWGAWFTVVGVAHDSKYNYLAEAPLPYFYVPFEQVFRADMSIAFYVRTQGNLDDALATLRREVRQMDPNVIVFDAMPLAEFIGASLYPQKVAALLLTVLGGLALVLAAVGLYSVIAHSVTQRVRELGIRMALGAGPGDVLGLVLRQGMTLTLAGLGFGVVASLALARAMAGLSIAGPSMGGGGSLLGVSATDPLIYAGAVLFLMAVAALATWTPARRAARLDPMNSLRHQ